MMESSSFCSNCRGQSISEIVQECSKLNDEKALLREWLSRIPEDFIADHQVPDDINTIKDLFDKLKSWLQCLPDGLIEEEDIGTDYVVLDTIANAGGNSYTMPHHAAAEIETTAAVVRTDTAEAAAAAVEEFVCNDYRKVEEAAEYVVLDSLSCDSLPMKSTQQENKDSSVGGSGGTRKRNRRKKKSFVVNGLSQGLNLHIKDQQDDADMEFTNELKGDGAEGLVQDDITYLASEETFDDSVEDYAGSSHKRSRGRKKQGKCRLYPCDDCEYIATRTSDLKSHVERRHGGGQRYYCTVCDYTTTTWRGVRTHQIKQHGAERIRKQLSDTDKTREQQQEKPANQFKCDTCDFTTRSRYALKAHDLSEHKDLLYYCEQCKYRTKMLVSFQRHQMNKHANQQFSVTA